MEWNVYLFTYIYIYITWKHPVETQKPSWKQKAHMLLMLQPPQGLSEFKPTSVRQATHFARQLATFLTVLFHSSPWQEHSCSNSFQIKWGDVFLEVSSMSTTLSDHHSSNPRRLFLTIGALSPGFWHRNCQWHSPMIGFEWLQEKPVLSSHS